MPPKSRKRKSSIDGNRANQKRVVEKSVDDTCTIVGAIHLPDEVTKNGRLKISVARETNNPVPNDNVSVHGDERLIDDDDKARVSPKEQRQNTVMVEEYEEDDSVPMSNGLLQESLSPSMSTIDHNTSSSVLRAQTSSRVISSTNSPLEQRKLVFEALIRQRIQSNEHQRFLEHNDSLRALHERLRDEVHFHNFAGAIGDLPGSALEHLQHSNDVLDECVGMRDFVSMLDSTIFNHVCLERSFPGYFPIERHIAIYAPRGTGRTHCTRAFCRARCISLIELDVRYRRTGLIKDCVQFARHCAPCVILCHRAGEWLHGESSSRSPELSSLAGEFFHVTRNDRVLRPSDQVWFVYSTNHHPNEFYDDFRSMGAITVYNKPMTDQEIEHLIRSYFTRKMQVIGIDRYPFSPPAVSGMIEFCRTKSPAEIVRTFDSVFSRIRHKLSVENIYTTIVRVQKTNETLEKDPGLIVHFTDRILFELYRAIVPDPREFAGFESSAAMHQRAQRGAPTDDGEHHRAEEIDESVQRARRQAAIERDMEEYEASRRDAYDKSDAGVDANTYYHALRQEYESVDYAPSTRTSTTAATGVPSDESSDKHATGRRDALSQHAYTAVDYEYDDSVAYNGGDAGYDDVDEANDDDYGGD